jgi:general secretion pathway protein K
MIVGSRQSAVGSKSSLGLTAILNSEFLDMGCRLGGKGCRLQTADCRLSAVDGRRPTDSGVILIALLWIMTALSVIALSFSRESFVEVAAGRNAQSLEESYFVARAGIDETVYRLIQKKVPGLKQPELEETPDPIDLGIAVGSVGGGSYEVDIQDESGRINLNIVQEEQLRALTAACGIPAEDAGIIVDSILDWKDTDNLHHLNGAEDDYYQTLNPPYKAKNARFDTIEELLLVRGVTPAYFYGYPERAASGSVVYRYGLSRLFTVYSNSAQININYAPLPVLMSLPGMPPQAAKAIYDRRHVKPFKTVNASELNRDLGLNLGPTNGINSLTTVQTGIYTLTASAHGAQSKAKRIIRAVIRLQQNERSSYQIMYWNENVPDYEGTRL